MNLNQFVIDFGSFDADTYLREGWSEREYGFRWAVGVRSSVEFTSPGYDDDVIVGLEIEPAIHPTVCPNQKLSIVVNGVLVAAVEYFRQKRENLQILVSKDVVAADRILRIDFEHPKFLRPYDVDPSCLDGRRLSFMFFDLRLQPFTAEQRQLDQDVQTSKEAPLAVATSAPPISKLPGEPLLQFESLGLNCEFGFVQRHFGVEPISLLRFAGMPFRKLMHGLQYDFNGLASTDSLSLSIPADNPSQGYIGTETTYQMMYHTSIKPEEMQDTSRIAKEAKRIQFLARKLLEDIEHSNKIFVMRAEDLTQNQILNLYRIVRGNNRGWLLWVVLDADGSRSGQVDLLLPGFLRGYMDRFALLELGLAEISYDSWDRLLGNAYALWSEHR